jgi:predicted ATPase
LKLTRIDVRFFRSFNYDYELKTRDSAQAAGWEDTSPAWYPFVRVPVEGDITAIVGANEAGKSQLLLAVKAVLTGSPMERSDFCRYSDLFSVQTGELRFPEFGGHFEFEEGDREFPDIAVLRDRPQFALYRPGDGAPFLVVRGEKIPLTVPELADVQSALPTFHELLTNLAIPDSVSIAELAGKPRTPLSDRKSRTGLFDRLANLVAGVDAATAGNLVLPSLSVGSDEASIEAEKKRVAEFRLARQLLVDAAGVDKETFVELQNALESGREGQVEALVGAINAAIRENINVQRWWSQDQDFELRVEARERELAFTIQDRTASKYSFGERSQGLRFFLSYFIQLTAHRLNNAKPDLLLLDEPDAFLSSTGQQDLLRVLEDYASPEGGGPRSQVIYVTHSPFLIDKNAPHRIRVLDKGSEDEGTRVVNDAANNRYEPLRSSLGQYVAETAFIGGRNLFVEGATDQILIAGLSAHLAKKQGSLANVLNLNEVTVVACGGADGVPYMVYLARGRDTVKPPSVALLDGDLAGREAEKVLKRGEARKKRILQDHFILRIDEWAKKSGLKFDVGVKVEEIEDLIPVGIVRRAALNYLARFIDLRDVAAESFTTKAILSQVKVNGGSTWKGLESAFIASFPGEHLEKVGLAREVVSLLNLDPGMIGGDELRARFGSLLGLLGDTLDAAAFDEEINRSESRLGRAIKNFDSNHPNGIKKVEAKKLMRELESAMSRSDFADDLRVRAQQITRDWELDDFSVSDVPRFREFQAAVRTFSNRERASYQDDAAKDPSADFMEKRVPAREIKGAN